MTRFNMIPFIWIFFVISQSVEASQCDDYRRKAAVFMKAIAKLPDTKQTRRQYGPMYPSEAYSQLREAFETRPRQQGQPCGPTEMFVFDKDIVPHLAGGQVDQRDFKDSFDGTQLWWELKSDAKVSSAFMGALLPTKLINRKMPVVLDCVTWMGVAQLEFLRRELGDDRFARLARVSALGKKAVKMSIGHGYVIGLVGMFWHPCPSGLKEVQKGMQVGDVICILGEPGYAECQPGGVMAASTVVVVKEGVGPEAEAVGFGYPEPVTLGLVQQRLIDAVDEEKSAYQLAFERTGCRVDSSWRAGEAHELGHISYWSRLNIEALEWAKTVSLEPYEDPNGQRYPNDASLLEIWEALSLLTQELKRNGKWVLLE